MQNRMQTMHWVKVYSKVNTFPRVINAKYGVTGINFYSIKKVTFIR